MTLIERPSQMGDKFWTIINANGTDLSLQHPTRAFAPWYVTGRDEDGKIIVREEFRTKGAALAFAETL